jgi:hemerythrin superfamily protein
MQNPVGQMRVKPGLATSVGELTMTTDTTAAAQEDAIDLLARDHRIVTELFKEFAKEKGPSQLELVQDICTKLTIHAAIEEELFYPAVRQVLNDDNLLNEAEVEHATAKYIIKQLLPVHGDDDYLRAKVTVLREYTKHHINEEESELFPKIEQSKLDLITLGQQLADRKVALQAQLTTPEAVIAFAFA